MYPFPAGLKSSIWSNWVLAGNTSQTTDAKVSCINRSSKEHIYAIGVPIGGSLNLKACLSCFQILTDSQITGLVVNLDMGWAKGSAEQRRECRDVWDRDDVSRASQHEVSSLWTWPARRTLLLHYRTNNVVGNLVRPFHHLHAVSEGQLCVFEVFSHSK